MARWKKNYVGVAFAGSLALIAGGAWSWKSLNTEASRGADNTIMLSNFRPTDPQSISRGKYIMHIADCAACHTAAAGNFAGGYGFSTGFGLLLSSNITPDRETGIGRMTERQFFNAVRQGIGSHGMLYPAMPYTAYRKFSDQDMHDLWAYISTIKTIRNPVKENAGMHFPYNIRFAMVGWNLLFFENSNFLKETDKPEEWNRGRYLVDAAGHCSVCHSPRNSLGAEVGSRYLQGAMLDKWYALNLTADNLDGLGEWSVEDIVSYLKTGTNGRAFAAGPMAEAVSNSTQYMTERDLHAIGVYLKSLPASDHQTSGSTRHNEAEMKRLADVYEINCSACHGLEGEGIKGAVPAFSKNSQMRGDPTNMIHAIITGTRAVHTDLAPTSAGMPSFAWKFTDQDIADILTYIRNNWENNASQVSSQEVNKIRIETGTNPKLYSNKSG
ncbi:cytochrome c [Gluconobacter cerinus]|uniref:Cytochrome C n=1 Tax=Gluconobacter cerinus TaxID=38307 RepID=A0A1B6VIP8_9PROT|nr:cytochrome c [Gluconobacter cerinus]OAJ67102.1 cytochrome C [Gluconobacter cerinus]